MKNPDGTTHPATFQPDLCEQLTPATVAVWLRRQGMAAHGRGDTSLAFGLGIAAQKVDALAEVAPSPLSPRDDQADAMDYARRGS